MTLLEPPIGATHSVGRNLHFQRERYRMMLPIPCGRKLLFYCLKFDRQLPKPQYPLEVNRIRPHSHYLYLPRRQNLPLSNEKYNF